MPPGHARPAVVVASAMMTFDAYITSGAFTRDAASLGFERQAAAVRPAPPDAFLARLPDHARASVLALVDLMGRGEMPYIYRFNTGMMWGFDFRANAVEVLDADFEGDLADDVFSLATDGGGNHHCLHVSGEVVVWNHEESNLEDHTKFASLDEALWCVLHREAVSDGNLAYDTVRATFAERAAGGDNGWSFFRDELEEDSE